MKMEVVLFFHCESMKKGISNLIYMFHRISRSLGESIFIDHLHSNFEKSENI